MSERQLEILQHALGADEYGNIPRDCQRNHFCAGVGDEPDCRALVALGYAETFERSYLPYYNIHVTGAGVDAMRSMSPTPPKLTSSQKRYRQYLDADSGLKFGEWLKMSRS